MTIRYRVRVTINPGEKPMVFEGSNFAGAIRILKNVQRMHTVFGVNRN